MNGARMSRVAAVLVVILCAAVALLVAELGKSAADKGVVIANPCKPRAPFPGHGIGAAIQRVVLDGLDGAACRLHTSREELVLSLRGNGRWDQRTIEVALRAGLKRSVEEAGRRGDIPGFLMPLARRAVETVPLEKLIEGGIRLTDLLP